MRKFLYLLSFTVDMLLSPLMVFLVYIVGIVYGLYVSIKYKTSILDGIWTSLKACSIMIISKITYGMKIHKKRLLEES